METRRQRVLLETLEMAPAYTSLAKEAVHAALQGSCRRSKEAVHAALGRRSRAAFLSSELRWSSLPLFNIPSLFNARRVRSYRAPRPARTRGRWPLDRAAMALSKLSGDEQGIILGQLCNTLEPRLALYFSSACTELQALLTPAVRQQLRVD